MNITEVDLKGSFAVGVGSGGASGKVAVVQLCLDSGRCDVMHIVHSGIPPSLVTILEDPSILKVVAHFLNLPILRSVSFVQSCGVSLVPFENVGESSHATTSLQFNEQSELEMKVCNFCKKLGFSLKKIQRQLGVV